MKYEATPRVTELRVLVAADMAVADGVDVHHCEDVPMKYYAMADAALGRVRRYGARFSPTEEQVERALEAYRCSGTHREQMRAALAAALWRPAADSS